MATKKLKPNTPGSRHRIAPQYETISKDKPAGKKHIKGKNKSGGRNSNGRITARGRGGGHKRRYRVIDFKRDKADIPAKVQTIEYDPNRSAHIALLAYRDGEKRYIVAPNKLNVDDVVISGDDVEPNVGNATQLKNMPTGTIIHNIELYPGRGGQMCRTAGSSAQLLAKTDKYVTIELPSDEVRMVQANCMATVGSVSNPDHFNTSLGKAGRSRWKGKRPLSRGVAKNPIDHPMGGGEGKASGGHPRSPWGLSAKGKKTRKRKKLSNRYIIRRKKNSN